ncbi:MAG TPA: HIRAN domain-containing protein [Pseudonocardiaceae bacterium]|nr:HIRAN domain-containing protein [Pseudonocardiaceae bacterium]
MQRREDGYSFDYLKRALTVKDFRPFLGFDDLRRHYVSARLFPLFRQRIVAQDRPDFQEYLETLGLDDGASPLAVLSRSGGSRPGDSIYLLREPDVAQDGTTRAMFFVHGLRYQDGALTRVARLQPGEKLSVRPEPDNPVNKRAVLVTTDDEQVLGWVPDVLVEYVQHILIVAPPVVDVRQVNGDDAPPNLRLLVELSGHVSVDYAPFAGPEWEPLV